MPYFKDSTNKLHFLSQQDLKSGGLKYLPSGVEEVADSEVDALMVTPPTEPSPLQQILDIELTITPRRLREAVITTAGKNWLKEANARIDALRESIT